MNLFQDIHVMLQVKGILSCGPLSPNPSPHLHLIQGVYGSKCCDFIHPRMQSHAPGACSRRWRGCASWVHVRPHSPLNCPFPQTMRPMSVSPTSLSAWKTSFVLSDCLNHRNSVSIFWSKQLDLPDFQKKCVISKFRVQKYSVSWFF